jgi:pimeloyl-ACP methyl ester carboxylesterase
MGFIDDASEIRTVAGREARVFEAGTGPPVVVLHGWGGRIESMAPVLQCLMRDFRTLALDLPGFGESPLPEETWGTPAYAAFLSGAMRDLGAEKAALVGHSYGAKTSLYLAATDPAAVGKLVLMSSSGLRTPPSLKARGKRLVSRVARAAGRFGSPGERLRSALYRRIASSDYRDAGPLRATLVKVVNEDLKGLLPQVRASTLLVWGSNDDSVPVSHARIMEKLIPDAGLVLFEGAGHFPYLDEKERFCRVLRNFLGAPGA